MDTYAHAFFTWAVAEDGVRAGRVALISGAVGSLLPGIPAFLGTAYFTGTGYLHEGWAAMSSEEVLDAIYFTSPFGGTGSALHSLVFPAALLGIYPPLRLGGLDTRRILPWFLIGWACHTVADFLTHVNDTRPLFWPTSWARRGRAPSLATTPTTTAGSSSYWSMGPSPPRCYSWPLRG